MGVLIYQNGAWTEASAVKEYSNSAWQDKDAVKVYQNGAWTEKWSSGLQASITFMDGYDQLSYGDSVWYIQPYNNGDVLDISGYQTYKYYLPKIVMYLTVEGEFVDPYIVATTSVVTRYYSTSTSTSPGYIKTCTINAYNAVDGRLHGISVDTRANSANDPMVDYIDHTFDSGTYSKIGLQIAMNQISASYYDGWSNLQISDMFINGKKVKFNNCTLSG